MRSKYFTRRNTAVAAVALAVGLVIGTASGGVIASQGGYPADKATAAGSDIAFVRQCAGQTVLTATMATAKTTDLILQLSAECAIETTFTRDGKTTHQEAAGTVRMWVEVDNQIVPVTSISSPPQNTPPGGDDGDKVTFCEREEGYDKTDGGAQCVEETIPAILPNTDPTTTTSGCEAEEWFQKVKTANAFNWLRLNVGSGVHQIVVKADITTTTDSDTPGEVQTATALIGNRTLVIEPTKMANDACITQNGGCP